MSDVETCKSLMRAFSLILFLLLGLPLQWVGFIEGEADALDSRAVVHAGVRGEVLTVLADDLVSEPRESHLPCEYCHAIALNAVDRPAFALNDPKTERLSVPSRWVENILIERPERPQWPTLVFRPGRGSFSAFSTATDPWQTCWRSSLAMSVSSGAFSCFHFLGGLAPA